MKYQRFSEEFLHCWNCGREHRNVTLCECGIDLWAYPHRVTVVEDEWVYGLFHVADTVVSQFRYAMRNEKPDLLP